MYGISMANGNGVFGQVLNGGFMIEGGAKALFFDPTQSAAWVLRMGLTLQTHEPDGIPLTFDYFGFDVSVRRLLRFSGIVSIGRDWFLQGALPIANRPANIRYGLDLGTRWGTQRVELNVFDGPIDPFDGRPDYVRRTNNYGGVALGLHGMVEVPMGSWLLFGGFRFEYGYNWGNILPNQNSNIHDVNLLFTTGFRF